MLNFYVLRKVELDHTMNAFKAEIQHCEVMIYLSITALRSTLSLSLSSNWMYVGPGIHYRRNMGKSLVY